MYLGDIVNKMLSLEQLAEGLEEINNLLPNGKFTRSVIYEVVFYEGLDASK